MRTNDNIDFGTDFAQRRLLHSTLHHARRLDVPVAHERRRDDWRTDILGRVDDFLNSRNAEGDVHRRHTGEMERLQRHLCAWLADGLCANGANCGAGLNSFFSVFSRARVQKCLHLSIRHVYAIRRRLHFVDDECSHVFVE